MFEDSIFPSSSPDTNSDPDYTVPVRIELDCGLTITGTVAAGVFLKLFRDPSDLRSVINGIPAGVAVSTVLPPSTILKIAVGESAR